MNNKIIKLLGALAFIVLLNVGFFTLADISITTFWISWVFIHIAFVITVCVLIFSVSGQKKLMFAYSESAVTTYYFIVELIAGIVLMAQSILFPAVAFMAQLIILAVYLVAFFAVKKMNQDIDRKENVRAVEMYHFKNMLESMKEVLRRTEYSAPYKKVIEHAYDAMAASPVKSSPEVRSVEQEILALIDQLGQQLDAGNEEEIINLCKRIETEVASRNRQLRIKQ